MKYCESIYQTRRWKTREVRIGTVGVGGNNPIRIQSMTTSNTRDVEATIDQIMRLADAGCEIARVTVQGMKEAEACEGIKTGLLQRGYTIPLVADIHFFPPAALHVADFVDKVRINPGNYIDKRASFKVLQYDDVTYAQELARLEEKFTPLVEKCKRLKRALRIGTNHGSLSDRIMNRYGDTPRGMVISAIEFAEVCRKQDYHDLVFSMKASNPSIMILAYRLLVAEMIARGWDYPLHLGVTEAGEGEDGRIKSAMGMGALLVDGLGDTLRVSLTEDPWQEIAPCHALIAFAEAYRGQGVAPFEEKGRAIEALTRRSVAMPEALALSKEGMVFLDIEKKGCCQGACHRAAHEKKSALQVSCCSTERPLYQELGCTLREGRLERTPLSVDGVIMKGGSTEQAEKIGSSGIDTFSWGYSGPGKWPILTLSEVQQTTPERPYALLVQEELVAEWERIKAYPPMLIFLSPIQNRVHYARRFFDCLQEERLEFPVVLSFSYEESQEAVSIQAAAECGALLCDGLGEGVWLRAPHAKGWLRTLSFGILQAARRRIVKTEFISCPGCGRTLFNIQEVAQRIRARTAHLPGVKIAIMGCIVNGPGEMADADFGYVGSKPDRIDLYIGKQCVEKDIHFAEAEERLVALIQREGKWVEPSHVLLGG